MSTPPQGGAALVAACTAAAAHRRDHHHAAAGTCHPHAVEVVHLGHRAVTVCHDCESDSGFLPEREAEAVASRPPRPDAGRRRRPAWARPPDISAGTFSDSGRARLGPTWALGLRCGQAFESSARGGPDALKRGVLKVRYA